ncbi:MAG: [FeFe] hydrogenase H-cluster maturation GTPase HydF [Armatimonadota bacterium]|jgi:[FeFe] hydrogenase H-cluster maturation GTPase HydF
MRSTPKGLRLHIGLFGRRNVGKSSLLNAITRQSVSIVSDHAGTTTDPVEKPMELLPLGPVLFIDTAGIDDAGTLGELRVRKTRNAFDRTDLAVLVTDDDWGQFERGILDEFTGRDVPIIVVFNKVDLREPPAEVVAELDERGIPQVRTVASEREGVLDFRQALLDAAPPEALETPTIAADLIGAGGLAVLVVPIDKEAPKGRLILPQVQTIRDLLDGHAYCVVVRESELPEALARLKGDPDLVVTDSQAFLQVAADTPPQVPMTSFSILFARVRGDLVTQAEGAAAVESLRPGDRVLVAEACSHHPIEDDIGRVKIPRWLAAHIGGDLDFTTVQGHDFPTDPDDLAQYSLVIHCGACMHNRREMLSRLMRCREAGVPITNYGVIIAHTLGVAERALAPFPAAQEAWRARMREAGAYAR